MKYRHCAGFGKRIEFYIIGLMLKDGLDCYIPLVDDNGIDVVIRRDDGSFIEVQIKARSCDTSIEDVARFAATKHEARNNYYFVFYSEWLDTRWIMSSEEYLSECATNKVGKNIGKHAICFHGMRKNRESEKSEPYVLPRYEKYVAKDFSRLSGKMPN